MNTSPLLSSWLWRLAAGVAIALLLIAVLYAVALLVTTLNRGLTF